MWQDMWYNKIYNFLSNECEKIVVDGFIRKDFGWGDRVFIIEDEENFETLDYRELLENLKEILAQAGVDFSAVVKTGVFLADMNDFAAMNEVYAQYFSKECPARACVEVSKLPKGALVEIELIAIAEW